MVVQILLLSFTVSGTHTLMVELESQAAWQQDNRIMKLIDRPPTLGTFYPF